ncbi:MAG: 3-deoxy-7-phosphoheptulonate synthase [bacterium]|nr:3-deoxy-7-phosphoheptulonate synthase [bacterium]
MKQTNNLRVKSFQAIAHPGEILRQTPITEAASQTVARGREAIENILDGKDKRRFVIIGPCSIHDYQQSIEYARRLNELRKKVEDRLVLVMRAYFEKPRTSVGWKGLIYDPYLDDSGKLEEGVKLARKILLEINEMGLPTATEVLGPITIQYYSDLVTWTAIGARTTESQTHRELASGLSMPVGFKNGTEGNVDISLNAIKSARASHHFFGMNDDGQASIVETTGNPYGHIVLRGGKRGQNYDAQSVSKVEEECRKAGIEPRLLIDCSHENSGKDHTKQYLAWNSVMEQINNGSTSIVGMMVESNLAAGRQQIPLDLDELAYGVSVTDACIGWEETEKLILGV